MRECVTHHNACDCREAKFAALEHEAEAYRKLVREELRPRIAALEAEVAALWETVRKVHACYYEGTIDDEAALIDEIAAQLHQHDPSRPYTSPTWERAQQEAPHASQP